MHDRTLWGREGGKERLSVFTGKKYPILMAKGWASEITSSLPISNLSLTATEQFSKLWMTKAKLVFFI